MLDINKLISAEKLAPCEADEYMMDWMPGAEDRARELAHSEQLDLSDEHMDVICWLRDHFAECGPSVNGRALSNAMEENFRDMGGLQVSIPLIPAGPVYQGCRLAGLPVPPGSRDRSFGSTH